MEIGSVRGEVRIEQPTARERTIARRAAEARATIPDLELSIDVDIEACLGLGASITVLLVRACALALRDVPRANAAYRDGRFELYSRVNVGLTVAAEDAYVTPTVFDADAKSLAELGVEIDELARKARAGALSPPELSGATFTLTDRGEHGVVSSTAIITPPQAAALAVGGVRDVPVIRNGAVVAGRVLTITLACDHRILYGAQAGSFLRRVKTLLEQARL